MTKTIGGKIRGKTIQLDEDLGFSEGQEVEVSARRVAPDKPRQPGEGLLRTEGALADDPYWNAIMEEIYQGRPPQAKTGRTQEETISNAAGNVMNAIRTIQKVTGPLLTIAVPADWAGKQVEVIILPVETTDPLPPELDPRYARYLLAKPPLTEEQKRELERNPCPLRGTVREYIDPYEPAVPPEDWEVYRDDPA